MKKVWCDSSWTHSMNSSRCLCRGLWRMLHPLTCRLRPSTHLERWRNRWVAAISVLLSYVVMVLSTINWLFLIWFFFCSLGTSWSLSKSICPNPLTGKEMALHHLWCQTKLDSEISREFWTFRHNIKKRTFSKSLRICFWLLYLIHQAFTAHIV